MASKANIKKISDVAAQVESGYTRRRLNTLVGKAAELDNDAVKALLVTIAEKATVPNDGTLVLSVADGIGKAVAAPKASVPATGTPKARKTRQKATQGAAGTFKTDEAKVYDGVIALLVHNDIKPKTNYGPDGVSLIFDNGDWRYQIWAPQWNVSGPDEGWAITYELDGGEGDPGYPEDMLSDEQAVIAWLVADMELQRPKTAPNTKPDLGKIRQRVAETNQGDDPYQSLVVSHLVTIAGNAAEAVKLADKAGLLPRQVKQLQEMQKSADALRRAFTK